MSATVFASEIIESSLILLARRLSSAVSFIAAMPTPPATGRNAKVSIDPTEQRIRRAEAMARKLARELEDIRDLLEIQRAHKADAGKKLLSLDEAWKKLGVKRK
jgi:hypothetical protein